MDQPYIFWQHDVNQTIPNDVWTPLLFNRRLSELPVLGWSSAYSVPVPATTVAVGSNGQALPQGTIQVNDTTGGGDPKKAFANAGFLAFRMPSNKDVVVRYTGRTPTSFTGCTHGVGTLTTGMAIRQGNVFFRPSYPAMTIAFAEVAWASNGTGVRGIRFQTDQFGIYGGMTVVPAIATSNPLMHIQTAEQPATDYETPPAFIEVYQNSTGPLDSVPDAGAAPRLVITTTSTFTFGPQLS